LIFCCLMQGHSSYVLEYRGYLRLHFIDQFYIKFTLGHKMCLCRTDINTIFPHYANITELHFLDDANAEEQNSLLNAFYGPCGNVFIFFISPSMCLIHVSFSQLPIFCILMLFCLGGVKFTYVA